MISIKKVRKYSFNRYSPLQSVALISPLLILLIVFYLYPMLRLFPESLFIDGKLTLEHYRHFFTKPLYSSVLIRTIRISLIVTLLCFIFGYIAAFFLANVNSKWKSSLFLACVLLPLWTSILVRTYSWIALFHTNGTINSFLRWINLIENPLSLLYNEFAVLVGMVHVLLPFMILPIYSVLKGIDKNLIRAAQNLGANYLTIFLTIIFPLSLPGVGAGVMFVFILALGFYITPALLGGPRTLMISTLIDQQVNILINWEFAAACSVILLITTVVMIAIFNKIIGIDKIYGG